MKFYKHWLCLILPHTFYGSKPSGGNLVPSVNQEERQLNAIADEKWANYKKKYIPIENAWMKSVNQLDNPLYHNQASSMVSNEAKTQFGSQTQGLADLGIGHRYGMAKYQDQANTISQSRNKANLGVTDRYLQGIEGVINMGQGKSVDAVKGLADVANNSVDAQIKNSQNKFDARQSELNGYGTFAGAGAAGVTDYLTRPKQ
jgi:hypothetical protein